MDTEILIGIRIAYTVELSLSICINGEFVYGTKLGSTVRTPRHVADRDTCSVSDNTLLTKAAAVVKEALDKHEGGGLSNSPLRLINGERIRFTTYERGRAFKLPDYEVLIFKKNLKDLGIPILES